MTKSMKARKITRKQHSAAMHPMTLLEQVKQELKVGTPNWFLARRESHPASCRGKTSGGVLLSRKLLRSRKASILRSFIPNEASITPSSPRSVGRPQVRPLRRFSGSRVIPVNNFTQIYNGDNRSLYRDASYPWSCIGRIAKPDGGWGTASLVGKSTVLTAAHVVSGWWTPGRPITENLTFVPAMFDMESLLGSDWVANVTSIAAWEAVVHQDGYDMAICQLDQPMGEWLGYFGAQAYDDDWEDLSVWTHAGYPYDLSMSGVRPSYELGIAVIDDDSDSYDTLEVETRADIASGQSGGPLWGVFAGDARVIGTLSGREDNFLERKNSLFAGGNGLIKLIQWGRNHWG